MGRLSEIACNEGVGGGGANIMKFNDELCEVALAKLRWEEGGSMRDVS